VISRVHPSDLAEDLREDVVGVAAHRTRHQEAAAAQRGAAELRHPDGAVVGAGELAQDARQALFHRSQNRRQHHIVVVLVIVLVLLVFSVQIGAIPARHVHGEVAALGIVGDGDVVDIDAFGQRKAPLPRPDEVARLLHALDDQAPMPHGSDGERALRGEVGLVRVPEVVARQQRRYPDARFMIVVHLEAAVGSAEVTCVLVAKGAHQATELCFQAARLRDDASAPRQRRLVRLLNDPLQIAVQVLERIEAEVTSYHHHRHAAKDNARPATTSHHHAWRHHALRHPTSHHHHARRHGHLRTAEIAEVEALRALSPVAATFAKAVSVEGPDGSCRVRSQCCGTECQQHQRFAPIQWPATAAAEATPPLRRHHRHGSRGGVAPRRLDVHGTTSPHDRRKRGTLGGLSPV